MNSGPAVVGNMGSRTRFDYTMLGDAVNLAARLEGVNKQFGTYTMISAATLGLIKNAFPARELSRIAVVGRKEAVTVFEPMYPEEYESRRSLLAAFADALALYYEGDLPRAQVVFEAIADQDPPAARYAERCRELRAHPIEGEWNGVWVMTSK
jgi:adenylate cyclase